MNRKSNRSPRTVCIVQRRLTHYRVPLFEALRDMLAERDIRLELLVGQGTPSEEKKRDAGEIPWVRHIETHYLAGDRICWQPVWRHIGDASLVIVTQENRLIQNHLLMLMPRRFKLAFWGHGANLQSDNPDGFRERFKRWTTNQVDWWFAYTQMSADLVKSAGFPESRITILNNAVDTSELQRFRQSITPEETQSLRDSLGFGAGPVGVFVGSLHADKRLDFLFAAAEAIREKVPDFHLLIVGDGPQRDIVQGWCDAHPWARWVGARFGREKVAHISVAQVMLNPGLVGLGILDSFICGVPMLTTNCGLHSPEIAYLEQGVNGLITDNTLDAFVNAATLLLFDPARQEHLKMGCEQSAGIYSIENMARNFAGGIERCLDIPTNRGRK